MATGAQGRAVRRALPERAERNQLGVRDGLRRVAKRATPPPAGLPVDERAAEEQHRAQRSRLSGESRLTPVL